MIPLTWQIEADRSAGQQNARAMINLQINIRRLRGKKTQREIAQKAGMTHANLCNFENGVANGVSIRTLSKLAEALNVTIQDLISDPKDNYTQTLTLRVHKNQWRERTL